MFFLGSGVVLKTTSRMASCVEEKFWRDLRCGSGSCRSSASTAGGDEAAKLSGGPASAFSCGEQHRFGSLSNIAHFLSFHFAGSEMQRF